MSAARSKHRKLDVEVKRSGRSSRPKSKVRKKRDVSSGHSEAIPIAEEIELTAERLGKAKPELNGAASYQPIFASVAKRMCILGAINDDLAMAFNVTIDTIVEWRKSREDFSEACWQGEAFADGRVERSLYARACGYEHKVVKVMRYKGRPLRATYLKHVPANAYAAILWLVNRKPDEWSYRPELKPKVEPETPSQKMWKEAIKGAEGTMFRPVE